MSQRESITDETIDKDPERQEEILQQTNKRLTLNLLIQGAAMHTFLTGHHVVKDELERLRPGLTKWYDQLALSGSLCYFIGDIPLMFGWLPSWFWSRVHRPSHPFHRHRLFATHGRELWHASKQYLLARAWKKRIIGIPFIHYLQMLWLLLWVAIVESGKKPHLARIAEQANSLIWGIDRDRLEAELTTQVAFGNLKRPNTAAGRVAKTGASGYGGVELRNGQFQVVAKAWNWPLVSHELTKGTLELICLHGLNTLDDELYHHVTDEADQIEYEVWMLQAGGEMWRRVLAAMPEGQNLSETLMHIARLDPQPLEDLMMTVVEDSERARRLLEELG